MSKGLVLVIDDDEWVCRLLAVAMKEAGFEITITENAADGFFRAVEEQPDCIVCDVDLPDHNGYWVAKKIRSHPSKIASAPLIFLSGLDDREHRLEGFQVGGDAYLTKPFRIDEVVAQVDALIQMARRLKGARPSLTSIPPAGAAMTGDLAQMSVGTLLTLVDLERRSGRLLLRMGGKKAEFSIEAGNVIGATLDGEKAPPLAAIRIAMHWVSGKFSFVPTETPATPSEESQPINALLMEAARLEDEARADEERPSSAPLASWKESIARSTRPTHTSHPPGLTPSAPPSEEGGSLSIFPSEPQPISTPPVSSPDSRVPVSLQPMPASDPLTVAEPKPATPQPATPQPPTTYPVVPAPPATPQPPRAPLASPSPPPGKPISTTLTSMQAQRPLGTSTPGGSSPRPSPVAKSPTFAPRPTPAPFKAAQPTVPPKPPKPALPKTGFAGAIRSLSPAHGIRAVTPSSPKPPETTPLDTSPKNLPPVPPADPVAEEPEPLSKALSRAVPPPPESLDSGWSDPPPPEDEEK